MMILLMVFSCPETRNRNLFETELRNLILSACTKSVMESKGLCRLRFSERLLPALSGVAWAGKMSGKE